MRKNQNLKNFNLMEQGLRIQAMTLSLEQKSMEELKLFKPHLEPLIEEMRALNKAMKSLRDISDR